MQLSYAWLAVLPVASLIVGAGESTPSVPARPQAPTFKTDAASCGECHRAIYAQWQESLHAKAWTDEIYQAWMKTKKKPEKSCYKCHIPLPVVAIAPKRPKTRQQNRNEGVTCVTCHEDAGNIHGPRGAKTEAHPSVKSELFTGNSVDLCQSCHRITPKPVISLGKDFERAKLAEQGKSCKGCHMPEEPGHSAIDPKTGKPVGEKRQIRSHRFLGGSSHTMIAQAFEFHRERKGDQLVLRLENKAGHRLPGLVMRFYKVTFEALAGGKVLGKKEIVISTGKNQYLQLGQSVTATFDAPHGAKARVTVNHWFQRLPGEEPKDLGVVFRGEK